jgi:hypothetical protein
VDVSSRDEKSLERYSDTKLSVRKISEPKKPDFLQRQLVFRFFVNFKITESQGRQDLFRSLPEVILHKSPVQLRPSKRDFRAKKSIPALELFWVPTIVNFAGSVKR